MVFLELRREPGIIFSSYDGDGPSTHVFVQRRQDSCLVARDNLGFSSRLGRASGMPLQLRRETKGPFTRATVILGLLSSFTRIQASSPLEALISATLWSFQRM